ncbi:hypothetical protein LEMLEM_LOCUS25178, partial [Lemmus lemmus]
KRWKKEDIASPIERKQVFNTFKTLEILLTQENTQTPHLKQARSQWDLDAMSEAQ